MRSFPIVFLCAALSGAGSWPLSAGAVCVNNAGTLQAALSAAEGSTTTTTIQVARGTYNLGGNHLGFFSQAVDQGQLDISGGYSSDCSTQIKNPALTIIDAQNMSVAASLQSTAGISVRYLTFQNGVAGTIGPGGLQVGSSNGPIFIDYNMIRTSSSGGQAGGLDIEINSATGSGALHLDCNLISGNSSSNYLGAGSLRNEGTGDSFVTNNTIVNNVSTTSQGGLAVDASAGSGSVTISNNILWGNTNFDLYLVGQPVLVDNDYQNILGNGGAGGSGDLSVDPQFSSSSDFHLLPTSPVLGFGTTSPAGNLPTIDIEGHPRSYNGLVDMGAYERGDEILADGFDD